MPNFEAVFTTRGFRIVRRCESSVRPQNPRERVELLVKDCQVAADQVCKALAVRVGAASEPAILLLPAAERPDFRLVARLLGQEVEFFPQEQIENVFGSPLDAVSVLSAPEKHLRVFADGRVFDQENVAVASGDPQVDLLVAADDLRAFLGDSLRLIDVESARKGKAGVIEPRTLKGFRDYLPEEMLPRQAMLNTIVRVFERFGFAPLQTPALEYSDILLGKLGGDAEKLLFRFRDNGGRDVCLRYDLTVPLARVAAQYPELPKPFKRYQIAPVWRAENPGRGRFREFFQCDCDIVGSSSVLYDAECIALGFAVMAELGVNVEIRFNNRKVLAALANLLAVQDEKRMATIFRMIDKLPSQGASRVRELLKTEADCSPAQIEQIMNFVEITGRNEQMMEQLRQQLGERADEAIAELRRVNDYVAQMCGARAADLKLDFSIARGLDYYTGTVYETFLRDLAGYGSVMSGGRYDHLIERYLGRPMPAVGISVGIDRLFAGLLELGRVRKCGVTSQVIVVPMDTACIPAALQALGKFRQAGIAAEIALENDQKPKLDKQLSLADKKRIPFAAILGSNEVAKGTVMFKDLAARQQAECTMDEAIMRCQKAQG